MYFHISYIFFIFNLFLLLFISNFNSISYKINIKKRKKGNFFASFDKKQNKKRKNNIKMKLSVHFHILQKQKMTFANHNFHSKCIETIFIE